jgi:hypothetical protein
LGVSKGTTSMTVTDTIGLFLLRFCGRFLLWSHFTYAAAAGHKNGPVNNDRAVSAGSVKSKEDTTPWYFH